MYRGTTDEIERRRVVHIINPSTFKSVGKRESNVNMYGCKYWTSFYLSSFFRQFWIDREGEGGGWRYIRPFVVQSRLVGLYEKPNSARNRSDPLEIFRSTRPTRPRPSSWLSKIWQIPPSVEVCFDASIAKLACYDCSNACTKSPRARRTSCASRACRRVTVRVGDRTLDDPFAEQRPSRCGTQERTPMSLALMINWPLFRFARSRTNSCWCTRWSAPDRRNRESRESRRRRNHVEICNL